MKRIATHNRASYIMPSGFVLSIFLPLLFVISLYASESGGRNRYELDPVLKRLETALVHVERKLYASGLPGIERATVQLKVVPEFDQYDKVKLMIPKEGPAYGDPETGVVEFEITPGTISYSKPGIIPLETELEQLIYSFIADAGFSHFDVQRRSLTIAFLVTGQDGEIDFRIAKWSAGAGAEIAELPIHKIWITFKRE